MTALKGHFANRAASWSWTELNRRVDGCKTALIEYEAAHRRLTSPGTHLRRGLS